MQTLRESVQHEAQRSSTNLQAALDSSRVAELEAAQAAAQAALMEEMELLRRQKQSSEGHALELDQQVTTCRTGIECGLLSCHGMSPQQVSHEPDRRFEGGRPGWCQPC